MHVIEERSYCFAGFTLDLRHGSLRCGEREIELPPRSVAVLCYFVENAGRLVTPDELMTAIWRDVIGTDEPLTHCISDIRSALGDSDQRIVKTVLRRGYTFLAPVTELTATTRSNGQRAPAFLAPLEPEHADSERLERRQSERRQLTILFCDLVSSTALFSRLDPEDLRDLMGAYHRACAGEINRTGGFAAEHWGDAIVGYFGYPRAQEDDAERAIHAALGLVERIPTLLPASSAALQVRIGIATGLVVVGDIIDIGDTRVAGDTPIIAARLQGFAEPGRIVIADSTRRLAGGAFDYRDMGRVVLRGLGEPIQAWEVAAASSPKSRFEAQRGSKLTPLVNREAEIELLLRSWQQARSGTGRIVVLAGEPGIGKSRLALELRERLSGEPHATVQLFCSPHHVDSPFFPIAAQIEHAAGIARRDTPEAKLEKLGALLGAPASDGTDVALLAELLSIPGGAQAVPSDWSLQRKKRQTLEALLRQLEQLSSDRPVLVVFEDVHWIDPSSRELLEMTVERVALLPVLLVVTGRPEFEFSWIGTADASLLMLGRLDPMDSASLATLVAADQTLPPDVIGQIVQRSDGVPIFVEELTKAVLEERATEEAGAISRASDALQPRPVPATLQSSLMARLDRLGPDVREVAEIGAAIGREFPYELLAPVAERKDADLQSALSLLAEAGVIARQGTAPQATYRFKHALLRDAAYERLLRRRRRLLHARIARTLEERYPDLAEQKPELLAQHWTEAGAAEKAIDCWARAAQLSRSRHALSEAVAQCRKGLALLSALDDTPARRRAELRLQVDRGWAMFHSSGESDPDAGEAFARARALCHHLGDTPTLGSVLHGAALHHIACAQFAEARRLAEELLEVARACHDAGFAVTAHSVLGRSFFWCGAYAAAASHFERALGDPAPNAVDQFRLADDGRGLALVYLALALMRLGHLDRAQARRDEAVEWARRTHPYMLAVVLSLARVHDLDRGMRQAGQECAAELAAVVKEQSFGFFAAAVEFHRAIDLCFDGETEKGLALARRASAASAFAGRTNAQSARLLYLAVCCEKAGRVDEALDLLDKCLQDADASGEHILDSDLHRLAGSWLLTHRAARHAEAEDRYRRALAIAREQQAKFSELQAATSLAGLWRDQGRRQDARDLLAPIYGWFTEGLGTPHLRAAKALLDTL